MIPGWARRTLERTSTAALLWAVVGHFAAAPVAPAFAQSAPEGQVALSFAEAEALAGQAWAAGNVPLANAVARKLTEAAPEHVPALLLLSASETALGRPGAGRATARRAFRHAETPDARYEAAYLVSAGAMAEERFGASQFWLRRAYQAASTDVQRDRIANAFGQVRRASPWRATLSFNIAPSSNVNGGSESPFLVIDDSPYVGVLSGSARALSGVQASLAGTLSYDIVETREYRTTLEVQAYRSFVSLSEEAQDIAPNAEGTDFEYGVAEVGLRHRVHAPKGALPDSYSVALGQTWYGGERLDSLARLTLGRTFRLGGGTGLRLSAEGEHRFALGGNADRTGTEVSARLFHRLDSGLVLQGGAAVSEVRSDDVNRAYSSFEVFTGFSMAEPMLGMRLSGRLSYEEQDYETYSIGFFEAPGGREDEEWRARLNVHFDEVDMMGFAPVISFSGSSSLSNISRFEGESFGVSLGFASAF